MHLCNWKLPFARVLVLANQEDTIFTSVMEALFVRGGGIDKAPLLRGCRVGLFFLTALVADHMRGIVVDVHAACIGVLREAVLVELGHFIELLDVLAWIAVVITHVISALLDEVDGILSHVQEDGRALDHEAHVDAHQVSAEGVVLTGVIVELILMCGPGLLQFFSQLRNILLLELVLVNWESFVIKT